MNCKLLLGPAALIIAIAGSRAIADEEAPTLAEQANAAMAKHRSLSFMLPSIPWLYMPDMRAKLELSEEQFKTIQHIGLIFNGKMADARQAGWAKENEILDKFSGAEREKALAAYHADDGKRLAERRKWALDARHQVEKLLNEKQLATLRELEFKKHTQNLIFNPLAFDGLKLDEEQVSKMKAIRDDVTKQQMEMMQKVQKLQLQGSEDLLKLLTPEQREKLRAAMEEAFLGQSMDLR